TPRPFDDLRFTGTCTERYPLLRSVARTDLNVEIIAADTALDVFVQYSTDLFDPATIDRYVGIFLEELDKWTL
uniref:hypothetical protein n=1 Tax=Nocardia sienata TaxID=248552 RepID=UPI000B000118